MQSDGHTQTIEKTGFYLARGHEILEIYEISEKGLGGEARKIGGKNMEERKSRRQSRWSDGRCGRSGRGGQQPAKLVISEHLLVDLQRLDLGIQG
jgi:hypothetical protein